jgi:glycosyltransferase involved in cell wall biosynthesis
MMQRVLYIQYTNSAAFPPLEHSSRILADAGWQSLFLSIGAAGIETLRFTPRKGIEVRQMSHCPPGWKQKAHYVRFALWALWWTLRWRPRWVYASDLLSCPAALLLSFLPGVRVIYHEHDSPSATNGSLFVRLSMAARRRLGSRAKLCVLPNLRRAEQFDAEIHNSSFNGHRPSMVVWNCPSLEELSAPRPAHDGGDLWVLYHGSIVPPRLPLSALEALARLPERIKLCVIGYETIGHRGYVSELRETAQRLGIGSRVRFPGALPSREELLAWCRKCDVGLAFMPTASDDINMQAMVGASNKPFDYLSCGLALLVSDLPDWRAAYVDTGHGLACDPNDPESIAAALRWFSDHPVEMRAMGESGRRKIAEEWNYERQFSPVFERMRAALR